MKNKNSHDKQQEKPINHATKERNIFIARTVKIVTIKSAN